MILLLNVLEHPEDPTPRCILGDWLEDCGDPRAVSVRKHCQTGNIYFRSGTLSGSAGVVHLAIQLVPQPLAVEFGCCCAEHALPVFAREFPNDDRPQSLTATVRNWLWGEATKTEVRRQLRLMSDVTDEEAAMPQAGQVWSREQEAARYAAVCAARSAAAAALAVSFPQKSNKWEQWVSQAALEAVAAAGQRAAEMEWQRREFLKLLMQGRQAHN
ncbi:MAG TPA: hypothetical protein VEL76_31120 [Gemmataceae bacterium]|nr:hypothetical protein [Gemmataceae bacterium]